MAAGPRCFAMLVQDRPALRMPMAKSTSQAGPLSRRPRLTDIAQLCGVSAATVSRVLNQDENFSARPEVRKRILDAAKQIGYAPDLAARNLNRGKTHIIGVFGSPHTHIGEGINDALFQGIAEAVRSRDYDVFFELSSRSKVERALPFWRFDGAILIQAPKPEVVAELSRRRVPYVTVNEKVGEPVASVLADDVQGTTLAMEHLADLGHRTIAYTNALKTYFPHYSTAERQETVLRFAAERGLKVVPETDEPFESAESFLRQTVMRAKATAVLSYDHRLAVAILGAANRLGMRVPEEISLVCFNDEFPVDVVFPPLTVVAVSGREMGSTAARLLLQTLETRPPAEPQVVRLPETLVVRASTAAAAG